MIIILGVLFVVGCICLVMAFINKVIMRPAVTQDPHSEVFKKYEYAMERLVQLYRTDNENLMREKDVLRQEITNLISMFDTTEDEADDEDDDDEVVLPMEPCVETSIATFPSTRLFRKIEAARKVVQHEAAFMPKETRAKLIALLTPENDVEAA